MSYQKPKYILTQVHSDESKVIHEFHTECLTDVLRHMEYFLRGCSFVIGKFANLKLVDELDPVLSEPKQKAKKPKK